MLVGETWTPANRTAVWELRAAVISGLGHADMGSSWGGTREIRARGRELCHEAARAWQLAAEGAPTEDRRRFVAFRVKCMHAASGG